MDITYTMIGADGQQYGPITLQQLRAWVGERRILPETQILRSDTNTWLPASQYVELGLAVPALVPAAPTAMQPGLPSQGNPELERHVRMAASWFFWIAGLSLISSLAAASGGAYISLFGLGVTRKIAGIASQMSENGTGVALGLNLLIVCLFVALGFFGLKRQSWSFILGMVLYALDALLLLGTQQMLPLAFHAYVLFRLFMGVRANFQLKAAEKGLVS